ncbi:hypothetical protein JCM11491_003500 [Sporobolomyces phaffii]
MSSMLGLLLFSVFLSATVSANTEVLNFEYPQHFADLPRSIDPKPQDLVLLSQPKLVFLPVQHRELPSSGGVPPATRTLIEFTYQIDDTSRSGRTKQWIENWQRKLSIGAGRTARLSWPASHPVELEMELYGIPVTSERATASFGGYLAITCRSSSVHAPASTPFDSVPVTIVVEPIWLGAIPESLVAGLAFVIVLVTLLIVGKVPQRTSRWIASLARTERDKSE